MCDFYGGFKLCTCDVQGIELDTRAPSHPWMRIKHNQPADFVGPQPLHYLWMLHHAHGEDVEGTTMGRAILPSRSVGRGLDADWLCYLLNQQHCFDFDYQPQQQDTLTLFPSYQSLGYLSAVYLDGRWCDYAYIFSDMDFQAVGHGLVLPEHTA
ncbi:hypothetical protein [Ottowia sp.]|uniref:hypothetical protein n=1 Tax=Ottowia sp. TaxID=1898956 RepID=UPI003A88D21A